MLFWLVFGKPITEFVAPKFPARNTYCCMTAHTVEYGPTELYDDEFGLGVIYSRGVEKYGDNKGKTITELENLGYKKTIQTGGMQIYLTCIFIAVMGIYNIFAIWRNKEYKLKHKLIRTVLCIVVLGLMLYGLTFMAVFWY